MANTSDYTGVDGYVYVETTVAMNFPVVGKNQLISCSNCFYYRSSSMRCGLNLEPIFKPTSYVGASCPFLPSLLGEDKEEGEDK